MKLDADYSFLFNTKLMFGAIHSLSIRLNGVQCNYLLMWTALQYLHKLRSKVSPTTGHRDGPRGSE